MERHGRGVVVQLIEHDVERTDRVGRDVEFYGRDIGVEEAVQRATDAIIIESGELLIGQVEPACVVPCGPLAYAVEWLARDEQVSDEQEQGRGGGDAGSPILARDVLAEKLFDATPFDEATKDRRGAHAPRLERFPFLCTCFCVHYKRGVNGVSRDSVRLAS
jgi:hypothetical protein